MKELILSLLVTGFAIAADAQGVEFEFPMFSKDVVEQGSNKFPDDTECVEQKDEQGNTQLTCGTDLKMGHQRFDRKSSEFIQTQQEMSYRTNQAQEKRR